MRKPPDDLKGSTSFLAELGLLLRSGHNTRQKITDYSGINMGNFKASMDLLLLFLEADPDGSMSPLVQNLIFPHARDMLRRIGRLARQDEPVRLNFWTDHFNTVAKCVLAITNCVESHPSYVSDLQHFRLIYEEEVQAYLGTVKKRLNLPLGDLNREQDRGEE